MMSWGPRTYTGRWDDDNNEINIKEHDGDEDESADKEEYNFDKLISM